jgi:uncharacterized membrane protein
MKIDNPNYVDPNYNIKWANSLELREDSPNIQGYMKQYQNNLNVNTNYTNDLNASHRLLKYMNSYHHKKDNNIYNDKQVEVNTYYIMKYQSESYILKLIIFFCGLALIGCLFYFKGFISETMYIIYLGIIISVGIITIIYNIYNLLYRDKRIFDEYDYAYRQEPGTDISGSEIEDKDTNTENENKCI